MSSYVLRASWVFMIIYSIDYYLFDVQEYVYSKEWFIDKKGVFGN